MKILTWVNKTPHTVRRVDANGVILGEYPPSDFPIRAKQPERVVYSADGTNVKRYHGEATFKGLPEPIREDTIYIVSGITASLVKRWNFVAPNNNPMSVRRKGTDPYAVRTFITFGDVPDDETR
jgi:hypothetical protein